MQKTGTDAFVRVENLNGVHLHLRHRKMMILVLFGWDDTHL